METIKKVISLEQYKSRFNHKTPYINNEGIITSVLENNWGEIPCDYSFKSLDECSFAKIKDRLPLVTGVNIDSNKENLITNNYCFRYKTMVYWYNWIINYGKKCKYFKLCKRNSDYLWKELNYIDEKGDFFDDFYGLGLKNIVSLTRIPFINESYSIGDVIEVNEDAVMFNNTFRITDDETRYELLVLKFIQDFFGVKTIDSNLSIPYIDIPIHISQTIDNLGLLTTTAKEWEPRKTYIVDDIVLYKGETYILKDGDSYGFVELTGGIYETFVNYIKNEGDEFMYYKFINIELKDDKQTPKDIVYDKEKGVKKIYYSLIDGYYKIFLPYISHKAERSNIDGEFIFNTKYWEVNNDNPDQFNANGSGIIIDGEISGETFQSYNIKTDTDSKLVSLKRYKKSIDEDGNILPFILDAYNSMDTELPYTTGIYNIYMGTNDIFRGDIMSNISIKSENEGLFFELTYSNEGTTNIYTYFYKDVNDEIENEIKIGNIKIKNIQSENKLLYKWEEVSTSTNKDETIESGFVLPTASSENFEKFYQIENYLEDSLYYTIYKCVKDKMIVTYTGTTNSSIYITPSMLVLGNKKLISTNGFIKFTYIKDAFLIYNDNDKTLKKYEENTGLKYTETYNYEISIAAINIIHNEKFENKYERSYSLYDYELNENDEVAGSIDDVDTKNYLNIGNIYSVTDQNGNIINYKRLLSEHKFIDVNFESQIYEAISTDIENLKKKSILSKIEYALESITKDNFQKDYTIKDEYTIGVEDISKSIDVNIERGVSSAFEKHHILCEIKSLSDLENYRNNLFNL